MTAKAFEITISWRDEVDRYFLLRLLWLKQQSQWGGVPYTCSELQLGET